jgi:hypothetical protein
MTVRPIARMKLLEAFKTIASSIFIKKIKVRVRQQIRGSQPPMGSISPLCLGDVCYPHRLEVQYRHLTESGGKVVFSWVDFIDDDSNIFIGEHFADDYFNHPQRSRAQMLNYFFTKGNYLCAITAFVEKQVLIECGSFNLASIQQQDFAMWIEIIKRYEISMISDKLVKYRVRANNSNLSSDTNSIRSIFEGCQIYRNFFNNLPIELFKASFADRIVRSDFQSGDEYELEKAFLYIGSEFALFKNIGAEKLFNLFQDEKVVALAKSKYDFGLPDLYNLTKDTDITHTKTQFALEKSYQQLQETQLELAKSHQQLQQTQSELANSHSQLHQIQSELDLSEDRLRSELEGVRSRLVRTQSDLVASHESLAQTQSELEISSERLQETQSELERSYARIHHTQSELAILKQTQAEVSRLQGEMQAALDRIAAMESSKFWKIRSMWLQLKLLLGFSSA